jgi:hypothetical protein
MAAATSAVRNSRVGAVDQREPLLRRQLDRAEPSRREGLGRRATGTGGVAHLALAHQRQRAVCQRRQVARASQAAVLEHDGGDAVGQQVRQRLRRRELHAGAPGRERRQPQQHHRPRDLVFDLGAGSRRVRPDQAALQLRPSLRRDVARRQRAEPGRDAVGRQRRGREVLHHPASVRYRHARGVVKANGGALPRDGDDIRAAHGRHPDIDDCHDLIAAGAGCRH